VCGSGQGPVDSVKPMEQEERETKEEEARIGLNREMKDKAMTIEWKRAQNWKDDLEGIQQQTDGEACRCLEILVNAWKYLEILVNTCQCLKMLLSILVNA
jgi:hypothetical protein